VSDVTLALRQVRFENKSFWRNPASAFFTFAFPLMFLVIFNLLFGNTKTILAPGQVVSGSTFYVPAIAAFSVITACYTNVAMTVSFARDEGVLKRKRGTPLPTWSYLAGRIIHATLIAILLVAIVAAAGVVFYNVQLPDTTMPAFLVTLAVGAATFCALGLAMSNFVPNAEAAPAVVNASILPLLFISDIFIPLNNAPSWLITFSNLFPIKHYSVAMQTAFSPFTTGAGFKWHDLGIVAIWGVAGLALAIRFFSWEPRK
jgi:ABC-2 type transport system permease protein